jgi:hypothetical protein
VAQGRWLSPPSDHSRTLFAICRGLAAIVAALLLALRPEAGPDGLLAATGIAYAAVTIAFALELERFTARTWWSPRLREAAISSQPAGHTRLGATRHSR